MILIKRCLRLQWNGHEITQVVALFFGEFSKHCEIFNEKYFFSFLGALITTYKFEYFTQHYFKSKILLLTSKTYIHIDRTSLHHYKIPRIY